MVSLPFDKLRASGPLMVSVSNQLRVSGFFSSLLKRFPYLARGCHE